MSFDLVSWTFPHTHKHKHATLICIFCNNNSISPIHLCCSNFNSHRPGPQDKPPCLLANSSMPPWAMGVLRHRHRKHLHHVPHWLSTLTAFTFLLFSSSASAITLAPQPSGGAVKENGAMPPGTTAEFERGVAEQKRLGGPGSSPPSCRSKCGWCTPCQPVHVPVQPGLIIRLEYYPEAWRCKCGNKLFMP